MKIYETIRTLRLEKSINQQIIADALHCDVSVVSNIELGKRDARFSEIEIIAKILHMSVIDLIGYPKKYVEKTSEPDQIQAVLQITLPKDKKEEVLRTVFGSIDILTN